MKILGSNNEYLIEFETTFVWISRYSDGHCKLLKWKGIAQQTRDAIKKFGIDRTIKTYLKIAAEQQWQPLYKPHRMPNRPIN